MKVWVFLDGRQQGPFDDSELTTLPGFGKNTKVWFEGLPKWYEAGTLRQLNHVFGEPETIEAEAEYEVETETEEAESADAVQPTPPERPAFLRPAQEHTFTAPARPAAIARPEEPCPPTYVGWAVFLFLCCCSPLSIAALASSICVSVFYGKGNIESARKASEVTAWLIMASIAFGMIPAMLMSAIF